MVRKGRFPIVGDGRQRRSMVYVDDLVDGVVRAELVECPAGRGWWIADARPYEINEIVAAVAEALAAAGLDVARRQLRVPAFVARAAAAVDAAIQRRHRYVAGVHVLGELGTTIACDISAAQTRARLRTVGRPHRGDAPKRRVVPGPGDAAVNACSRASD